MRQYESALALSNDHWSDCPLTTTPHPLSPPRTMINVGIAGIGFMGMIHYLAYQKIRGVKVRAICEQDPKRLAGDWRTIKGNFGPQGEMMDLSRHCPLRRSRRDARRSRTST